MMKLIFEGARGLIYVVLIVLIARFNYHQGRKDAEHKFKNHFDFYSSIQWMENPPTILHHCWTTCGKREVVTWEEYVRRYHASKMRLDNPDKEGE